MGMMNFLLPGGLTRESSGELQRACVAGGPDNMPWPTEVLLQPGHMSVRRSVDESCCLVVPWEVNGGGRLMGSTGTLMERQEPYHFRIELARGKVNQLRSQAADWQAGGMTIPPDMQELIRTTSVTFSRAISQFPLDQGPHPQVVLDLGYQTAHRLVALYVEQMFDARHQRQPRLDTGLGCKLGSTTLSPQQADLLLRAFNGIHVTLAWNEVEPNEAEYHWEPFDALVEWAKNQSLALAGGPLIDFSGSRLPSWLWLWQRDLSSLASFMCDYVETVLKRYAGTIRTWQLTNASNCGAILGLGEDEFLWLTARLVEAARQVDPKLELIVGIAQPWGEYMAVEDRTHSPFIFADTLIRSGLNLAAIDLELVFGISPRGSYCRDLLETSRMFDLYSLLGVPLRVTLGYPSGTGADPRADPELTIHAGHWRGGISPPVQAEWAAAFAALALCKPSVRAVNWVQWTDAGIHQFPHLGLLDPQNQPKPALEQLRILREKNLR